MFILKSTHCCIKKASLKVELYQNSGHLIKFPVILLYPIHQLFLFCFLYTTPKISPQTIVFKLTRHSMEKKQEQVSPEDQVFRVLVARRLDSDQLLEQKLYLQ